MQTDTARATRRKSRAGMLPGIGTEFVDLFAIQGWSLYEIGSPIENRKQLEDVIRRGRVRPARELQRYILLPRTPQPSEPESVLETIRCGAAGYAFYFDQQRRWQDGEQKIVTRGVFWVDSVMLTRDHIWILVDVESMFLNDIPIPRKILGMKRPSIVFDVLDMHEKIPQITNAGTYPDIEV